MAYKHIHCTVCMMVYDIVPDLTEQKEFFFQQFVSQRKHVIKIKI
jgi:hypothetical protein